MANRKHHHHQSHQSHERTNSKMGKRHKKREANTHEGTKMMTVFEPVNAPVKPAVAKDHYNDKIKKDMQMLDVESKHTARGGSSKERVSSKERAATATGKETSSKEYRKEKTSSKERLAKQMTSRDTKSRERGKSAGEKHQTHPIPKYGSNEFVGTGKVQQPQKKRRLTNKSEDGYGPHTRKQTEDGLGPIPRKKGSDDGLGSCPRNRMVVSTPPIDDPPAVKSNAPNSGKMRSKTGSSSEDTLKDDLLMRQEKKDKESKEKEEHERAKSPAELVAEIPDEACLTAHQPIDKVRYKMVCYNGVPRYEVDTTYIPPEDETEDKLNIYSPPTSPTPPTSPNVSSPTPQTQTASVPVFPVRYKAVLVNGIRRFVPDLESGPVGSTPPATPTINEKKGKPKPPSETAIPPGYQPSNKPPSVPATPLPCGQQNLIATTPPTTPQRERTSPRNVPPPVLRYRMVVVNGVKRYEPIKD
uniref:Abelson helper integration site 1 n=1 Tax=Panagrellus redivivus TaxID=6233 RepID=A0A7E4WDH1_PANRE